MKLIVIKLIATILFGFAVLNYMAQNSTIYKKIMIKQINNNVTPDNKAVVILIENSIPTA